MWFETHVAAQSPLWPPNPLFTAWRGSPIVFADEKLCRGVNIFGRPSRTRVTCSRPFDYLQRYVTSGLFPIMFATELGASAVYQNFLLALSFLSGAGCYVKLLVSRVSFLAHSSNKCRYSLYVPNNSNADSCTAMPPLTGRPKMLVMAFKDTLKLNERTLVVTTATLKRMMCPGILTSTKTMFVLLYHVPRGRDMPERSNEPYLPKTFPTVQRTKTSSTSFAVGLSWMSFYDQTSVALASHSLKHRLLKTS